MLSIFIKVITFLFTKIPIDVLNRLDAPKYSMKINNSTVNTSGEEI